MIIPIPKLEENKKLEKEEGEKPTFDKALASRVEKAQKRHRTAKSFLSLNEMEYVEGLIKEKRARLKSRDFAWNEIRILEDDILTKFKRNRDIILKEGN